MGEGGGGGGQCELLNERNAVTVKVARAPWVKILNWSRTFALKTFLSKGEMAVTSMNQYEEPQW